MISSALLLSACSVLPQATEDPTRYYVLTTNPATSDGATVGRHTVHIRSIEVPSYLKNTKSMVVRRGANELIYEDFSRWAEPLESGIYRVLKERLSAAPSVRAVIAPPFSGKDTIDIEARVRVHQCEGGASPEGNASAIFSASYELTRVGASVATSRVVRKTYTSPPLDWDGKDFSQLAKQLSAAVETLAEWIGDDLPKAEN